ncbi:MAG: ferrous iron transporter B [Planctomycetota bacterium]|nr:MAG: ferrous iron transporter B [Planctomycetota bacterium]
MTAPTQPLNTTTAFAPTRIAMVGNPNVGKTSLFNRLCGVRAKTANFPGSTVDARIGTSRIDGAEMEFVDLPGVYALDLELPESKLCRDCLAGRLEGCLPDALLVVIDATNLARGLRLYRSIASAGRPLAVALTMTDLARARGLSVDSQRLSVALGVPCVVANGRAGTGIEPLAAAIRNACEASPQHLAASLSSEWIDATVVASVGGPNSLGAESDRLTDRLDAAFTHPILGGIVFLLTMALLFFAIYRLAEVPMTAIEDACAWLGAFVASVLPEGALRGLIVDGVIGGVSGTLVFLPQICLLFFLLALLEDTGYLARAAFVMDRIMCRFGLPGQAFVPLLSSHACALPGIMSTRLIPDRADRLTTILVAPFMSCSARVGVYVLLVTILFPNSGLLAGLAFAACYALGAIAALLTAALCRRTILRGKSRPMVLELPPYRLPDVRSALLTTFDRAKLFLRSAGTVILSICIVLWWLSAYPMAETPAAAVALEVRAVEVEASGQSDEAVAEIETLRHDAEVLTMRAQQEHSFAGRIGRALQPAFAPLGLDDRLTIAVLTSFLAREVFRSTMTVLVGQGDSDDDNKVADDLAQATRADGSKLFDPATSAGLLVFYVLALQCLPTLAVTAREAGGWKWAALQFGWMSGVAYALAFITREAVLWMGIS